MRGGLGRVFGACAVAAGLSGCFGSRGVEESGVRIGDPTLRQFEAGITTEGWLIAILGPPTSWAEVRGVPNTRVLRYATSEESRGFISFFSGKSTKTTSVTYFIVTDGIVTRFWADRALESTPFGKQVEVESGSKSGEGQGADESP